MQLHTKIDENFWENQRQNANLNIPSEKISTHFIMLYVDAKI